MSTDLVLKQTRKSIGSIRDGILNMDVQCITMKAAQELVKFSLSEKESKALAPYMDLEDSRLRDLTLPEQFLLTLHRVPLYQTRLKSIMFLHTYQEVVSETMAQINVLQMACHELRENNADFKKLLRLVLATSLLMNQGRHADRHFVNKALKIEDILKVECPGFVMGELFEGRLTLVIPAGRSQVKRRRRSNS
jgi:hypothetical protein